MSLTDLVRLPGRVAAMASRLVVDHQDRNESLAGRRRGWVEGGRAVVMLPGLSRPRAAALRRELISILKDYPGVAWVCVNAPLERLLVGLDDPGISLEDLLDVVAKVEADDRRACGSSECAATPDDDKPLLRATAALVADMAGLALSTTGRVLRWVPGPAEAAAVITAIDTHPRLRTIVEHRLGRAGADTTIAVVNALAQGVVQGAAGLGVDMALRVAQVSELRARRATWSGKELALLGTPEAAEADAVAVERPGPLPEGPVERYARRSAMLAAAGAGVSLAVSGNARVAAAIALATLPKAAGAGREMFAACLGRILARRGVLVMDHVVLRQLDRIDTVVVDVDALVTGRLVIGDVLALPEVDVDAALLAAHALFDPTEAAAKVEQDGWVLAPLHELKLRGPRGAQARRRLEGVAKHILGLARGSRLHAVVGVVPETAQAEDALLAACHRAGLTLVLAGGDAPLARADTARKVPGGVGLLSSVRGLQAEGHVVMLISRRRAALGNADCGIGVTGVDGAPAWGAHVLVGEDLEAAALLVDAAGVATTVSRRGVLLAEAGSVLGAVTTISGTSARAGRRALLAVNGAAALSLVHGAWAANELARRPLAPSVSPLPWHMLSIDRVLAKLDTGTHGLTGPQARRRRSTAAQVQATATGLLRAFAEELANPLTPILAGGAALSAAIGSVVDAGVVIGASGLGAVVGAAQRVLTERAVAELLARSAVTARVRRDGHELTLRSDELVSGDVIVLAGGDVVPADCRLLEEADLEIDESSLTGESFPVHKAVSPVAASAVADRTCMVYEATTVASGRGVAVVVATGASTEAGRSMATAQAAAPTRGVEARLAHITKTTLPMAFGAAGAVMIAGLLRGRPARQTISAGVGLAVASVPEGLPFLVSAAQLAAARRLSRQGVLVRNARTIEALGRVNVLCFDKTGTLTQGKIRLAALSDGRHTREPGKLTKSLTRVVAAGLRATPEADDGDQLAHLTDMAVWHGAQDLDVTRAAGAAGWREVCVLAFEPSRGYHATLAQTDNGGLLSVKGAPEVVLARCNRWVTGQQAKTLTANARQLIGKELQHLTSQGYRVLAVAERAAEPDRKLADADIVNLNFLGLLGMADPVRGTAGASLDQLQNAGAQIMMITGDHPDTAEAIAAQLGILNGHRVVTGAELDSLDDEALDALVPQVAVIARSTPEHKVRIVKAFQRLGKVVAMTGDGANDAPAIRLADIGIALGRRATPAARAAADLVVTDERLETIISALVEGRAMWKSVREALGILVGGNIGEIAFTVFGAALTGTSPLSARQLLLVNLLTDLAPAMAIALRHPPATNLEALLAEGPETSLGAALTHDVALRATATASGAAGAWLVARATGRERRARTVALAALVGTQLTQTILLGYDSPAVVLSSLGSAAVLAAVIQTPAVSHFFGCTPLGPVGWTTAAMAAGAASLGALALPALTRRLPQKLLALPHLDELWRPIRLPEFSTSWTSSTTVKA